jgi:hypothetical protein
MTKDKDKMANTGATPDFLEIETDNFVSPNAANDMPEDGFIPLDMGTDAPVAPGWTVAETSVEAPAALASNPLAIETSVVTGPVSGAFGTIRAVETPVTGSTHPLDTNPTMVTHEGPDVFQARRLALGLPANARLPAPTVMRNAVTTNAPVATQTVIAAITPGTLIANLLKDGKGKIFLIGRSDRRATHRTRTEIIAALATVDRADLAPRIKTSKAQFGEVMRGLNAPGQRMKAWNVTRADLKRKGEEWPEGLASRWCVGLLDGSDALGSLGEKVLIADLMENNEIRFYGGNDTLHQKVSDAFVARVGEEMYNATDVLNWFRRMMADNFCTVEMSGAIFVPGNEQATESVCGMIAALKPVMSRSITTIDAVSGQGLFDGLAQGLLDEVTEIQESYHDACERAIERDKAKLLKSNPDATEADLDLVARRAVVLPEAAGTYVRRLNEKSDRVNGYETMLGTEAVAPVRALIASLRATIEPLCDSTSAMAANIEF